MQSLCHWEVQRERTTARPAASLTELIEHTPDDARDHAPDHASEPDQGDSLPGDPLPYARILCNAVEQFQDLIDRQITGALADWSLKRLNCVDRNVLRLAVAELLLNEVPTNVVFDEAIEIAKQFGSADSPKFVNAALDTIHIRLTEV
jgi:N utilization substance protein B